MDEGFLLLAPRRLDKTATRRNTVQGELLTIFSMLHHKARLAEPFRHLDRLNVTATAAARCETRQLTQCSWNTCTNT